MSDTKIYAVYDDEQEIHVEEYAVEKETEHQLRLKPSKGRYYLKTVLNKDKEAIHRSAAAALEAYIDDEERALEAARERHPRYVERATAKIARARALVAALSTPPHDPKATPVPAPRSVQS